MKPTRPATRIVCRPAPLARAVAAAAATAAGLAASWAVAGHGNVGVLSVVAGLLAAAAAAAATAVWWPRFATDVLRLHGSVLPSVPPDRHASPLWGRLAQFVHAGRDGRLTELYAGWQAAVGAGVNYQTYFLGTRQVMLAHVDDVRHVLLRVNPPRDAAALRHFGTPISPGVILLLPNGPHAVMRRLLGPYLLGPPTISSVLGVLNRELGPPPTATAAGTPAAPTPVGERPADGGDATGVWTARFDALAASGTPVDVDDMFQDLTLDVIHHLIFSTGWAAPGDRAAARSTLTDYFRLQYLALVPAAEVVMPRSIAELRAAGAWWMAYVAAAEARRRAAGIASPPADLFDLYLTDVADPAGAFGGDWRRLAADVMGLMAAGFDTSAHAMAWTVHELLAHPEVTDRLRAEFASVFPADGGGAVTAEHLAALPYATAVWQESLRKYPPVPLASRRALTADLTLPSDGSVLPAGTTVAIPVYALHHNSSTFPSPDVFDPSRWLAPPAGGGRRTAGTGAGAGAGAAAKASFMPFSAGGRNCPGQQLSGVEWKVVLGRLLLRYDLEAVDGAKVPMETRTTMRPAGLRMRLRRRGGGRGGLTWVVRGEGGAGRLQAVRVIWAAERRVLRGVPRAALVGVCVAGSVKQQTDFWPTCSRVRRWARGGVAEDAAPRPDCLECQFDLSGVEQRHDAGWGRAGEGNEATV